MWISAIFYTFHPLYGEKTCEVAAFVLTPPRICRASTCVHGTGCRSCLHRFCYLALIGAIAIGALGVIWYPLKRLIRMRHGSDAGPRSHRDRKLRRCGTDRHWLFGGFCIDCNWLSDPAGLAPSFAKAQRPRPIAHWMMPQRVRRCERHSLALFGLFADLTFRLMLAVGLPIPPGLASRFCAAVELPGCTRRHCVLALPHRRPSAVLRHLPAAWPTPCRLTTASLIGRSIGSRSDRRRPRKSSMNSSVAVISNDAPEDLGGHVFVTGLARAGTTHPPTGACMRAANSARCSTQTCRSCSRPICGQASHVAPANPSRRSNAIMATVSPSTSIAQRRLTKCFWRILCGKSYIRCRRLAPASSRARKPSRATAIIIRLVLRRRGRSRYLTKCNNNILRLGTLAGAMPDCTFLLVIRAPLTHARQPFCASTVALRRVTDQFRRDYIRWLAHHEFGIDHRPFRFADCPVGDPNQFDYWLATWLACYSALEPIVAAHPNICVNSL